MTTTDIEVTVKHCNGCDQTKPVGEFYKRAASRDGLRSRCKACGKAYEATPEYRARHRAYQARYYAERRQERAEYGAAYRKANPQISWAGKYRQRCKQYGLKPHVEPFTKADVIARYGDECLLCGGPFQELDHWIPISAGGVHTLSNATPLCRPCNQIKNNGTDRELARLANDYREISE